MRLLLSVAVLASASLAQAREVVTLASGFRIQAERHEVDGQRIRLHTPTGVTELSLAEVTEIEQEEVVTPPAAPATPPASPLPAPAPVTAPPSLSPRELVEAAAKRHGLPPEFVQSVAAAESAFRTDAVSHKGAIGLMQLMPGTAAELSANPHDPAQNADAGARLLRQLLLKYDGRPDLALAAYNAGPGAVARHRGIPPYRETQSYIAKVLRRYQKATEAKTHP